MSDDKKNPQEIFFQAIEIESVEEQQVFLDRAYEGDDELRVKVDGLIRAYQAAGNFLEEPIAKIHEEDPSEFWEAANATQNETTDSGNTGDKLTNIGPYKLLQQIGEGGMGSVYMAQQERPVKRRVALKVIKAGMDSKQVIARFEAERQALALMDHPNIARLLDVGTTETGRPYFVMELVKGIPITEYCDQKRLNVAKRLELFTLVCNAVQHAHQKGIIHRDLKPNNILIAEYDEKVVPKIIDFGLAKALGQSLTDKTMFTQFGQVMGTLAYMSPEQSKVNALDVDTRADIYSLGVLLYELLTGSTPFDEKTFREAAFDQVMKIIREEIPPKPSTRLSSKQTGTQIAPNRDTDTAKLGKLVRGDLDWIVMKALEKERSRRYETANAFADDINRYINNEAIVARPPTAGYRFSKFVKKNRGLVTACSLIALTLVAGIIGTSIGLFRADEALELANQKTTEAGEEQDRADIERDLAKAEAKKARKAEKAAQELQEQAEASAARANYALAINRWDQNLVREANELLEKIPPKYRSFEWHFAQRQFRGSYLTLYGHTAKVRSVRFSPDGARICSTGFDNTIKIWDATTGRELTTISAGFGTTVVFSSDFTRFASVSRDPKYKVSTINVWDAATGQKLTINQDPVFFGGMSFSPDGSQIAAGCADNTIKIWDASTGQELRTLVGHKDFIISLSFSPDGTRIASTSGTPIAAASFDRADNTIKVWDAATGQELTTIEGNSDSVRRVSFSPDGARIASASRDRTIKIWDAATGQELRILNGHQGPVTSVFFSPNGTWIASRSYDSARSVSTIEVWDAATGQELTTLEVNRVFNLFGRVNPFSPDGMQIASGSSDNTVKICDATSGEELRTLAGHTGAVTSVSFSPDGARIASGSVDNTIKVWDVTSGQQLTVGLDTDQVNSLSFSRDAPRMASGNADNTIKVWDATKVQEVRLKGHTDHVNSLSLSPDGTRIASASEDGTIKIWDATNGQELKTLNGHEWIVYSVFFSPDGARIATRSHDNTIKIWDASTGKELTTFKWHGRVSFSPDGARIACASHSAIKVRDAATGQELTTLKGHTGWVSSISFSPDGTRIASASVMGGGESSFNGRRTFWGNRGPGSVDNSIKIWDASSGQELRILKGHTGAIKSVSYSPDGTRIASASGDRTIKIWDAATGQELRTLKGHKSTVNSVNFSPDGARIASGSDDHTIKIWDATTGQELMTLKGHKDPITGVNFSPDGAWIASRSNSTIKVWNGTSGQEIRTLQGHSGVVNVVSFSPDNTRIASASDDRTIKIWDAVTGQELRTLAGHTFDVKSVSYSPDGTRIASASGDLTIKIWDAAAGQELRTLKGHKSTVNSVNFSPDGARIASGSDDHTIKIWDAATGQELRTIFQGTDKPISSVSFSPDGTRIYGTSMLGEKSVWDVQTGGRLLSAQWQPIDTLKQVSSDGRWLITASLENILLVDLDFKNRLDEKSLRKSKSKLNPIWHREQAKEAARNRNSYAETFHRAWVLKATPDDKTASKRFREAYERLRKAYVKQEKELSLVLPPIVAEVLELPH